MWRVLLARVNVRLSDRWPSLFIPDTVMLLLAAALPLQQQEIGISFFHLSAVKVILWPSLLVWAILIGRSLRVDLRASYRDFAPPLVVPLVLLGLLLIPSLLWSLSASAWAKELARYGLGVSAYALLYYWIRTRARENQTATVRLFLQLMALAGAASVLVLIWQDLNLTEACSPSFSPTQLHNKQTSFFIDPNYYGEFLVMLLPLTIALALTNGEPRQATAFWIMALVLALGVVMTLSRSALFVMGLVLLALAFYLARSRQFLALRPKPALVALALLVAVGLPLLLGVEAVRCRAETLVQGQFDRAARVTGTGTPKTDTNQRLAIWQSGLAMIRSNPWFGAGLGNFELQFPFYRVGNTGGDNRAAHNTFIRLWAETGVFSFITYLVFLSLAARWVIQCLRESASPGWRLVLVSLFIGWLASLVESFFLDEITEPYYWIFFGIMMGVATIALGRREASRAEKAPLRVLWVEHKEVWGGGQVALWALLRELSTNHRREIEAVVLCSPRAELLNRLRDLPITVQAFDLGRIQKPRHPFIPVLRTDAGRSWLWNLAQRIVPTWKEIQLIRRFHVDVICANGAYSFLACALAAKITGVPVVWIEHNATLPSGLFVRTLIAWASHIIVVTTVIREQFVRLVPQSENKITVIHNGVSSTFPRADSRRVDALRQELGLDTSSLVVGTVGRLASEKGQRVFLQAAAVIRTRVLGTKFLIVGEGPQRQDLESLAHALGISQDVVFAGFREEVTPLLQLMAVFALPSLEEAFPLAILEAMAAGLPVVASDVGGLREVVKEEQTGFLVQPEDWKTLAETLITLLQNPTKRGQIGRQARAFVLEHYPLEKTVAKTLAVLQSVKERNPRLDLLAQSAR